MEQFNLYIWLKDKSRKVVTRDGRPVRIVCWDLPGEYKVVGVTDESDDGYTIINKKYDGVGGLSTNDLFFADEEEEFTEFEKEIENLFYCTIHPTTNAIKEKARQLLDLARKELEEEGWRNPVGAYKNGCEQGKTDALEDLPKWKKATEDKVFDRHILLFEDNERVVLTTEIYEGEYYIEADDLKTLPKEE